MVSLSWPKYGVSCRIPRFNIIFTLDMRCEISRVGLQGIPNIFLLKFQLLILHVVNMFTQYYI